MNLANILRLKCDPKLTELSRLISQLTFKFSDFLIFAQQNQLICLLLSLNSVLDLVNESNGLKEEKFRLKSRSEVVEVIGSERK